MSLPSETAGAEANGERARSDRPRRTHRYVDRESEDESRQASGRCCCNGKAILDSLLMALDGQTGVGMKEVVD